MPWPAIGLHSADCVLIDLREAAGHDGRYFVTGGGLGSLEGTVGIADQAAGGGELRDGVIGPVVHGHVGERVRGQRRGGEGHEDRYCQKRKHLLHVLYNPLGCVWFCGLSGGRSKQACEVSTFPSAPSLLSFLSGPIRLHKPLSLVGLGVGAPPSLPIRGRRGHRSGLNPRLNCQGTLQIHRHNNPCYGYCNGSGVPFICVKPYGKRIPGAMRARTLSSGQ